MLHFVYVSIDKASGIIFLWLCCKCSEKFFFYWPVNTKKPNFVYFLLFVGAAASFTAKISSFETVAKREAILNPVPKQWISKDIPSYGSQSERTKIAIHWFGEYFVKTFDFPIKFSFLKYISWFHKGSFHFSELELDFAQKFWFWFHNWTWFLYPKWDLSPQLRFPVSQIKFSIDFINTILISKIIFWFSTDIFDFLNKVLFLLWIS